MKTFNKVLIVISAILIIIGGILVLTHPGATLVAMTFIIGILALVSGISSIIVYCTDKASRTGWVLFDGIITIIISLFLIGNEWIVLLSLPFLFGMWMLFGGVQRIVTSIDLKAIEVKQWWILLVFGILCTILGFISFLSPITAVIQVTLIIGISLILYGVSMFFALSSINKLEEVVKEVKENK